MGISTGVGLISGIDFESIINQISEVNRRPIQLIQQKQETLNRKSDALGKVMSDLRALQTAAEKISSSDSFHYRTGTSSNESALSVSAEDSADLGQYSVRVMQLAQSATRASQGFASETSVVGSEGGSITVQIGSAGARTYELTDSTTLLDLRNMINDDAQSDVRATIVNDGSASNPYRLVLSGKTTGSANDIDITASGTSVDFMNKSIEDAVAATQNTFDGTVTAEGTYTGTGSKNIVVKVVEAGDLSGGESAARVAISTDGGLNFGNTTYAVDSSTPLAIPGADGVEISFAAGTENLAVGDNFSIDVFDPEITKAQDAMISVDGITVRRDSNTFSNVIDGVTFTAKGVSGSPIEAGVKGEPGQINADISKFQKAFNNAVKTIHQLRAYDEDTDTAQPLFGDSGTRSVYNQLKNLASTRVGGFDEKYSTLASLGMRLQEDGTYAFNTSTLNQAMEEDLDAVTRIFANFGESSSDAVSFVSATESTAARDFRVSVTQAATTASLTG
ncbi:MAG: flagellar filament capping protein FliD, partial [Candidatus Sumerlaeota bacterium]